MTKGLLLIDGNNIGHAANSMKPLYNGDMQVQAIFGFLRILRPTLAAYNMLTPVVLWDGRSWRKDVYPEYKANREKDDTKADKEKVARRAAYKDQLPHIRNFVNRLGVRQMLAMNLEADDLAGMLTTRYEDDPRRIVMLSGDEDWIQLVRERVSWRDPFRDKRVSIANFEEKTGLKTPQDFLSAKALIGDIGDNIPGVKGIGKKTAAELISKYGSVENFINMGLTGDLGKVHKRFTDFAENEDDHIRYSNNIMLMNLKDKRIPKPRDLRITHSPLDRDGFEAMCKKMMFNSITKDVDGWLAPFTKEGIE